MAPPKLASAAVRLPSSRKRTIDRPGQLQNPGKPTALEAKEKRDAAKAAQEVGKTQLAEIEDSLRQEDIEREINANHLPKSTGIKSQPRAKAATAVKTSAAEKKIPSPQGWQFCDPQERLLTIAQRKPVKRKQQKTESIAREQQRKPMSQIVRHFLGRFHFNHRKMQLRTLIKLKTLKMWHS